MTPGFVFVTVPSLEKGRKIAAALLQARLAACVNIIPGLESHYWWQSKLECGHELLLIIKTSAEQFDALSTCVKKHHDYECPEIVFVPVGVMAPSFLDWWTRELNGKEQPEV